ncbi:MAG: hypothetical protein WCD80_13215 [Desulfobaccales bacterium]
MDGDRKYGLSCKRKLIEYLEQEWGWGELSTWQSWIYANDKRKILALYSKFHESSKYWFGISQNYLEKWDGNSSLALLMREGNQLYFVWLEPQQCKELFSKIASARDGSKKINLTVPCHGRPYIQKWEKPLKIFKIGTIDQNEVSGVNPMVKFKKLSPATLEALKGKSPEEITELLANLPAD